MRYPNVYGIDMPTKDELIASLDVRLTPTANELDTNAQLEQRVADAIGADKVVYQV